MEAQKVLKGEGISIIADVREEASNVIKHLEGMEVKISKQQLKVADYICSERVAVERKTVEDFLGSIMNQRIFRQMEGLADAYQCPVLLIEGNPDLMFLERNMNANAVRGALASIAVDYSVPILWTRTPKETAHMLYRLAWREQVKGKRELQIRVNKKARSLKERQEFLVAGLPHVSNMLSRRLLKHFGSPGKIFKATAEGLEKVEGIGKKKAKQLWEVVNEDYEKGD